MNICSTVLSVAKSQIGYREGFSGGHWNNIEKYAGEVPGLAWANGQPWCAVFVSWVAMKAGAAELYPRTASCDVAGAWFKKASRWSEYPAVGAQVFYGTPSNLDHTGIVVAYDASTITTVEGNTNDSGSREGDGVYLKTRPRQATNVVGYGYPKFPEGIVAADPRFAGEAPATLRPNKITRARDLIRGALRKAPAGSPRRRRLRDWLKAGPKR